MCYLAWRNHTGSHGNADVFLVSFVKAATFAFTEVW